jgi:hypothetical protein
LETHPPTKHEGEKGIKLGPNQEFRKDNEQPVQVIGPTQIKATVLGSGEAVHVDNQNA